MQIRSILLAFNCLLLINTSAWSQQPITTATLLNEMIKYRSVAEWSQPSYTTAQASSYDRRSIAADKPGWFANTDQNQFIRMEENQSRQEYVMMDAAGPGAVVRFWLTTQVKPGTIRFYLDENKTPAIEIPAYDLLKAGLDLGPALLNPHSSYEASGKGGNTLYLPIPYQKHCKITFEFADSAGRKAPHYYQINYRRYSAPTIVKTFSKEDLLAYKATVANTEKILWHPTASGSSSKVNQQLHVSAKTEGSVVLPKGNAAIAQLIISFSAAKNNNEESVYRSTILKIEFDGKQTVWCPLGDFAGSGYGRKLVKSWYREMTEEGKVISRWLMPYQKSARISIINTGDDEINVTIDASIAKWTWNERSMYFHCSYKSEEKIKDAKWDYDVNKLAAADTAAPIEWNFINIKGEGIYVGNTLAVDNLMKTWYGEGDAKAYVDGELFPSEFGTGLEDYYNTSWAPVVLYQTPFANAPRADNESSFGHNTFTRTRNLDGIPFKKSFRYDLEMLSWDGGFINAASTVYWYGKPGAEAR